MKKLFITAVICLIATGVTSAQSLAGRIYSNPNIMTDHMNKLMKEVNVQKDSVRAEAIAKIEKEKGRKATTAEEAEIDKSINESMKKINPMLKGMKMSITVEFLSDKDLVMKMDTYISDEVMKAAGISWIKRKAMKAALAIMPSKEKGQYILEGNNVIFLDAKEGNDTLQLSKDGKHLYGTDKDIKFTLTRTK